ncbi:MAG: 2-oxo acid dehydrogenase subunit E2 [Synergistaceae bacterium]|jgi:pyruvate dehydrogenase E2 component (dihydrolipoamide acetyltransferase)|nr:2-oxo acid dehydrogenase subunit E2 [Synergistaceae bacterium]
MATTITMPKLGLTMNSGSVQQWKKKIGDTVKKGELLYVVATDKLTVDVESPAEGVLLAITIKEGQDVPVGAPIGAIGAPGEQADVGKPAPAASAPSSPASAPVSAPKIAGAPITMGAVGSALLKAASPKAKKLARENGADLSIIHGTGSKGWVVARDVLEAGKGVVKASPVAAKMAAEAGLDLTELKTDGRVMKADVQALLSGAEKAHLIPMTPMRRVIGDRMLQSHSSIPAVSYFADVDMTALNELRAFYNERLKERGIKVSVNDLLMKFCAKLLLKNPMLNAKLADGKPSAFILHDFVNVGFAVALPGGLLVPNVKDVHLKGVARIAEERAELVEKARGGGLAPDQMTGGTFTISNLGMMGVGAFTPIINPPEAAILGVGTTTDKPVVVDGAVAVRSMATFCLTADHRLVDGADGAAFLSQLKELVEQPNLFPL